MDIDQDISGAEPSGPTPVDTDVTLWYTGTPAEAIQLALSQHKIFLVWICLSNDSTTTSESWATLWADSEIKSTLSEHAVSLRLEQGTTDAAMFLQLVSSSTTATEGVWIIFAGQLLDFFTSPPSQVEMLQRLQSTITKSQTLSSIQPASSTPADTPSETVSDGFKAQLAARRAKLEAAKRQHDKEERAARRAAAAAQAASLDPERQKYITQQAKARAEKKSERENILREIENDKLERKLRTSHQPAEPSHPSQTPEAPSTSRGMDDGVTRVSVRLPDSHVIRKEFEGGKALTDVRSWIDSTRNDPSAAPYVLQTTFPTRTFEASEEHSETLHSILGKGGQLIMKEIKTYSEAYSSPGTSGVVSLASSLFGSVTETISNVFGWNTTAPVAPEATPETPGGAIREARIRNMNYSAKERGVAEADDDDDKKMNWFNGNGLAQEAPPEDDEMKN